MTDIEDIIRKRTSVRTFDGRPLKEEDVEKLREHISSLENPFGVPIEFRILDPKKHGLSSAVVNGEDLYLSAKMKRGVPNCEIAYGYAFEEVCLFALSIGVGTVMLAASLSRQEFEKAMEVGPDEVMPVGSPLGYPAKKRSIKDAVMRKGLKADQRRPFGELFYSGTYGNPLDEKEAGIYLTALEMARLAPSAANKQPWRAIVSDGKVHFYERRTMRESPLGDIQKVDVGIALCHFDLTMKEEGRNGSFFTEDPGFDVPDDVEYIISYKVE